MSHHQRMKFSMRYDGRSWIGVCHMDETKFFIARSSYEVLGKMCAFYAKEFGFTLNAKSMLGQQHILTPDVATPERVAAIEISIQENLDSLKPKEEVKE